MTRYTAIKDIQPELVDCFFAFNKEQIAEGWDKIGRDKKLVSAPGGLIGTREGITKLFADYDAISKRIGLECDPQEVYDYEYDNHECGYTNDDLEAIKITASYFTDEQAKLVKRRNAYVSIENLFKERP